MHVDHTCSDNKPIEQYRLYPRKQSRTLCFYASQIRSCVPLEVLLGPEVSRPQFTSRLGLSALLLETTVAGWREQSQRPISVSMCHELRFPWIVGNRLWFPPSTIIKHNLWPRRSQRRMDSRERVDVDSVIIRQLVAGHQLDVSQCMV